jgi:glycosyltransferase involved in cell wall biosynthesis
MHKEFPPSITANQKPETKNYLSRYFRRITSQAPILKIVPFPERPQGISIIMRVKNEADWITPSILSIKDIADEIVVVDNGSSDGTYQVLEEMAAKEMGLIKIWRQPDLDHCSLSNFAVAQTKFRWVFRWDGDMVAHTSGTFSISSLRDRLLSLNHRCYYVVYLRHINLSGDLFHQDPKEMVHVEEYIHTFSLGARYVHPGRFEAIRIPKFYRVLFWYEPYSFHVNVKPAERMLLRYFWEDWMELKDYQRFPTLEDYVNQKIEDEFGTSSWEEAKKICVQRICRYHIRYNPEVFGQYPEMLEPYLNRSKYLLKYQNSEIVGREED